MASFKKRGDAYYIQFYLPGTPERYPGRRCFGWIPWNRTSLRGLQAAYDRRPLDAARPNSSLQGAAFTGAAAAPAGAPPRTNQAAGDGGR
jgi:hypothetical protein